MTIIVGVAGGTGSGKTTLARKIMQAFTGRSILLSHDFYYNDNKHMPYDQRIMQNYDHPNSLETSLLVEHLHLLKEGISIKHPTYNFETQLRNDEWILVEPASLIVVEGILLFENKELCDMFDLKVYVDTDADIRFIRRLRRDVKSRGRSMDSVINQYISTVKPMHEQFVEPYKRKADIIIPEGGHNKVAADVIINAITKQIL